MKKILVASEEILVTFSQNLTLVQFSQDGEVVDPLRALVLLSAGEMRIKYEHEAVSLNLVESLPSLRIARSAYKLVPVAKDSPPTSD